MKINSFQFLFVSGILILIFGILPAGLGEYLAERDPALVLIARDNVPYQPINFFEQSGAVFSGFIVKPAYMSLSLLLIIFLWNRKARDVQLLRWGLIFFLAGEVACAINYNFYRENSAFMEYLHSFGMALGIAYILLALIEGLDSRLIRFTSSYEICSFLGLCNGCS